KGYRFRYSLFGEDFVYSPSLRGEHQGRNAAMAVAAALALHQTWKALKKNRILLGLSRAEWPGRLEAVSRNPLVILDGAHNEEGANAVRSYVRDFLPRPLTLVFGIMKDKPIRQVAGILFPLARVVIITTFPYKRAAAPEKIKDEARKLGKRLILEPDTKKAIQRALEITPRHGAVLISGSLFLVGEAKRQFPEWA
ncbi:MAG: hypothetical protein FJY81_04345, partial [Candidatus Aminicenantes bacterium]|nr:hypothetical protein [Candidatus Aminicenantes bacterium]